MKTQKGQAAIEYLILTGFMLLILVILLIAAYSRMSGTEMQVDTDASERAVLRLQEAADFVYIHGHPTKLTIQVYFPNNLLASETFIGNNTINLAMFNRVSHSDVWATTRGDVGWDLAGTSNMPTREGYFVLVVESTDPQGIYNGTINVYQ